MAIVPTRLDTPVAVWRGMHLLLHPVAGKFGASTSDVNFLFPSGKADNRTCMVRVLPKYGNRLAGEFANCDLWTTLIASFREFAGQESACAKALQALEKEAYAVASKCMVFSKPSQD